MTGQPIPAQGGILLDITGLPLFSALDETNMTVTTSANYNGGRLEDELNQLGWTLGHSPQSLHRSSVGGWVATMATGQFSSLYGGIEDLIVGYTVILASGEEVELSASPRAAMGPDLRQVFIGSEGTLAVIVSVTLKIFPVPEAELLETIAFPSVGNGLDFLREQTRLGLRPFLVRLYDEDEARHAMVDSTFSKPVMFLGTRGTARTTRAEFDDLTELAASFGGTALGSEAAQHWMARRFDFSTVENLLSETGGFAETIEVAHTWSHIKQLHGALRKSLEPLADEVLAHFSHVYSQGTSMYVILLGRTEDDDRAIERLEEIWATAMSVCLELGAELSHHHGGGMARSPYSRQSLGAAHRILHSIKSALDPAGILNPGKLGL